MKRHNWAWRTDKEFPSVLFAELAGGRLRQGWGYDASQDLRLIQQIKVAGGDWWNRLTDVQKETMPQYRILGDGDDSVQVTDIVLVPNLPTYGLFSLVEIVGDYSFSILDETRDHGHIRPVRLLTPQGVNPYSAAVHASLRATLRTPMRMWNLDGYADHIDAVLKALSEGSDLLTAIQAGERLVHAWRSSALRALADQLARSFKAAEWEYPVVRALSLLYPGAEVKWTAGRSERGADAVIVIPNRFGGSGRGLADCGSSEELRRRDRFRRASAGRGSLSKVWCRRARHWRCAGNDSRCCGIRFQRGAAIPGGSIQNSRETSAEAGAHRSLMEGFLTSLSSAPASL